MRLGNQPPEGENCNNVGQLNTEAKKAKCACGKLIWRFNETSGDYQKTTKDNLASWKTTKKAIDQCRVLSAPFEDMFTLYPIIQQCLANVPFNVSSGASYWQGAKKNLIMSNTQGSEQRMPIEDPLAEIRSSASVQAATKQDQAGQSGNYHLVNENFKDKYASGNDKTVPLCASGLDMIYQAEKWYENEGKGTKETLDSAAAAKLVEFYQSEEQFKNACAAPDGAGSVGEVKAKAADSASHLTGTTR